MLKLTQRCLANKLPLTLKNRIFLFLNHEKGGTLDISIQIDNNIIEHVKELIFKCYPR